jgi:PAS domain S-box-containing protein
MSGITAFALVFASCLASFLCQSAQAQTSTPEGRRMIHEYWTFKEGAPEVVESLAQTADGYLWLGAESGLFRFDGVRFERFQSPFGEQLPGTDISSLFAPRTGGLWIGYRFASEFSFLKNGKLINFRFPSPTGTINGFAQDDHGVVWAATNRGVWRFNGSSWQQNPYEWRPEFGPLAQVGFDREGTLWALTERKGGEYGSDLFFLLRGGSKFRKAGSNLFVIGFTRDFDQTVLTTHEKRTSAPGSGLELEDSLPSYPILRRNSEQLVDRDNGIWVASIEDPLFRHRAGEPFAESVSTASLKNSQSLGFDPYRYSGMVDREGSVWYGSVRGLHRFGFSSLMQLSLPAGHHWVTLAPDEGGKVWISTGNANGNSSLYHVADGKIDSEKPQHGVANFAYRAPDKTYWFAGEGGLWHMAGGRLNRIELPPTLTHRDHDLQAITQDRQGGMWVALWNRGVYRFDHGSWTQYGGRRDLPMPRVVIEFTDPLGRIWFGSRDNVLAVLEGDSVRTFGPSDGIQVGDIAAIYGRGSEIWIGGEFGLQQFDHGRFHSINGLDTESLRGISGVVETANGDLWVNGQGGIFHVRHSEIAEALRNPGYRVSGERFGRGEGLPGLAPQYRPLPSAIEGTDGRLWFTVNNGVVWLDPARASTRVAPPPVTIESVSADDKGYPADSPIRLPARTSSVQISYAALSLSDPEAIRFRYKLQEMDKEWHDAGTTNSVSYRNLAPGSYHFVVAASDTNGLWSNNTATAEFTVLPAYYQTAWFRALLAAAFMTLLWAAYQYRMWQVQREGRQLRNVIEAIPAYVWSAEPDGSVDFINRRWLEFSGLSPDRSLGWGWADALHPEDRAAFIDAWRAAVASGKPVETEARMRSAGGQYRWLLFRSVPQRDPAGKIVKWYGKSTDIDDRKHAEESLRENETRFRTLVDHVADAIFLYDFEQGTIVDVNPQACEGLGYTRQELLGKTAAAFHPDPDRAALDSVAQRAAAGETVIDTHWHRRKDGTVFPVEVHTSLFWFGGRRFLLKIARDVSERLRAEEAVRRSEKQLRDAINTIPAYVWSASPDGTLDFLNQRCLEFSGHSFDQSLGHGWASVLHPEDRDRFFKESGAAIASGEPFGTEARYQRADGQYRWLLVRGVPLRDETGTIVKWYGANTDIDDRKHAEEALKRSEAYLAEAQRLTHTGSWALDLGTEKYVYWSEELFRVYGFDPQEGLPTREAVLRRILPEYLERVGRSIQKSLREKLDTFDEYRISLPDGTIRYMHTTRHPVPNGEGDIVELVGTVVDITERKRAEEERERLRQLEAEIAHINRVSMMGELAASIAHEVNQPLTGIVANGSACLRFLAGDAPNLEEARESVSDIVRDGKRAGDVIARIRSLTKRAALPREKLDLNETIREVLAIVGDEAKRKSVVIRTQFADGLWPVLADRVQLQQVLLNLVMNAMDAMSSAGEGARQLVITTQNIDQARVRVTVEDSGTGLDPNTMARIFEPFFTTKSGGMGMGLSISRSILENHGGRLWATANDGPGTSFHFTLPREQGEDQNARVAAS